MTYPLMTQSGQDPVLELECFSATCRIVRLSRLPLADADKADVVTASVNPAYRASNVTAPFTMAASAQPGATRLCSTSKVAPRA